MIKFYQHFFLLALLFFVSPSAIAAEQEYSFSGWSGSELPVFYARPSKINKATRLVVVMHGRKRNAEEYRNQWQEAAEDLNLLVIVPEFSERIFLKFGDLITGILKQNIGTHPRSLQHSRQLSLWLRA